MTRITIVGSSHVGALKQGWDLVGDRYPGVRVRFFAVTGRNFLELKLGPGLRLGLPDGTDPTSPAYKSAMRVNGVTWTDLADGDVVLRAGLAWPSGTLAQILVDCDIDGVRESRAATRMSRPCFAAICRDIAAGMVPSAEWRGWVGPTLLVLPRPILSEDCLQAGAESGRWRMALRDGSSFRPALDLFFDEATVVLAEHGISLVRPPAGTAGETGLTRSEYSRGSIRLAKAVEHPETDFTHMNARYGVACIEAVFERLGIGSDAHRRLRDEAATIGV